MASPQAGFTVEQPSAMELWRAARGERVTYSEIAWVGASTALVAHASLHFFSAAIYGLERFLVLFGPPESLAFALTDGAAPIATWLVLLVFIGIWGALIGVVLLTFVHEVTNAAWRIAEHAPHAGGVRMSGMKIRIGTGPGIGASAGLGAEGFNALIDTCESIGWDSFWFSERVSGDVLDPLAAMGVAIGRTKKLKFGTSVIVLPGRNPVLLAKELASLDVLSEGRIVPVFGLGSPLPAEHEFFGVKRSERAGRTDEATKLIVRLWTEDNVTHEGKYFTVHDLTLLPKPVQQPHPDVWFGGHSEAAARRVGRIGTGWLPSFVAGPEYKERVELIKAVAAENDREIEEDHYGALVPYVPIQATEDETKTVLSVVGTRRPEVDPKEVVSVGGDDALRQRLEEFIEVGATKFVVVPALPVVDWGEELQRLYDNVVTPLEN